MQVDIYCPLKRSATCDEPAGSRGKIAADKSLLNGYIDLALSIITSRHKHCIIISREMPEVHEIFIYNVLARNPLIETYLANGKMQCNFLPTAFYICTGG